jgi:hypothetical protein
MILTRLTQASVAALTLGVLVQPGIAEIHPAQTRSPEVMRYASLDALGWAQARPVPGTLALNVGGDFENLDPGPGGTVEAISCPAPGACTMTGSYVDGIGNVLPYVVNQLGGRWGRAAEVPGIRALESGWYSDEASNQTAVTGLSCAAAGSCVIAGYAVGYGSDPSESVSPFLSVEVAGRWRNASTVKGIGAITTGNASATGVACGAVGSCSVIGEGHGQPFVDDAVGWTWGTAHALNGLLALDGGRSASPSAVSCRGAGFCTVAGTYRDALARTQVFSDSEVAGAWQPAVAVPGVANLNAGGLAHVSSVICVRQGICTVSGWFTGQSGVVRSFVLTATNGVMSSPSVIDPAPAFGRVKDERLTAIACPSASHCVAVGSVATPTGVRGFTAREGRAGWGDADPVPGELQLDTHNNASLNDVGCAASNWCSAVGYVTIARSGDVDPVVVDEVAGVWRYEHVPLHLAKLDTNDDATLDVVACAASGACAAGGSYTSSLTFCNGPPYCLPSPPIPQQAFLVPQGLAPPAPTGVRVAIIRPGVAMISWEWHGSANSPAVTRFVVSASNGTPKGVQTCSSAAHQCEIGGLPRGTVERFLVTAAGHVGSSEPAVSGRLRIR